MQRQPEPVGGRRRAFTLVELLLVIAIIGVLIAILVPALGGAREAARKAQTSSLLTSLGNAVGAFGLDNDGQAPGLFSVRDMGHSENGGTDAVGGEGLSAMENMILALAGQDAVLGLNDVNYTGETDTTIVALVGPRSAADSKYWVNPSLIGTGTSYFDISPEFFVAQTRDEQQMSEAGPAATEDERGMGQVEIPDLVDAWGQPILAWVKDEYGATQIRQAASDIDGEREKFVQIESDNASDGNDAPAWFYWNSNAAFLRAQALGKKRFDMSIGPDATDGPASIIGGGMRQDEPDHLLNTMCALLGASGFATLQDSGGTPYMLADVLPTKARGSVVLHSAGRDGLYLSSKDRGMATATADGDHIDFGANFYAPGTEDRLLDDQGQPTSVDVIADFDDLINAVGN